MKISIFWFRRDLRLNDNAGLYHALNTSKNVLPVFIFDSDILNELDRNDARVTFLHKQLLSIHQTLAASKSGLKIYHGKPIQIWASILKEYDVEAVYTNKDYEPYAAQRDNQVEELLTKESVAFHCFKDQVIFEESEVTKDDGLPYTVYTPYKNKWYARLKEHPFQTYDSENLATNFLKHASEFPSLSAINFTKSSVNVRPFTLEHLQSYDQVRDLPFIDQTSYASPHLRFGTVSVRQLFLASTKINQSYTNELVWREFFMQILFHFPRVVEENFKVKYNLIPWRNNKQEFELWCKGQTGYPMVDAGMRQLNQTGYMHNRVRMITAGFLCKHLLIDWKWGEAYFAKKLLDYDLSANNGNWQWAAGTGCDAAPYFRVFNPTTQLKKFDSEFKYVRQWIPEFDDFSYPKPMVDHKMARERAIEQYKVGLSQYVE